MSHISKGDIHAYLDGALGAYPVEAATHIREHLDACLTCAELLEGERRLRSEASAILAASTPGQIELDSFEELLARATVSDRQERAEGVEGSERTRSARPLLGSRLYSLRWAAMVVVSLGAGWMARDLTGPAGEFALDATPELVVQGIELVPLADQERLERDDAGVPAEAETSRGPLPAALPETLLEALPEPQAVVAGVLADGATPSDADRPSDLRIAATRFVQPPVPPESQDAAAADPGDGRLDDNVVLDQVEVFAAVARQRAESSRAPAVGAADTSVRAQAEELQREEPEVEALALTDEPRRSAPGGTQRRAIAPQSIAPQAIALRSVLAASPSSVSRSATSFLVPGLRVLDVRVAPEADGLPGRSGASVVVTQELEDGRIIELQFVPGAGTDPALGAALRERDDLVGRTRQAGWGTARREVPGGVAILSGPLTDSELEDLLDLALGPR